MKHKLTLDQKRCAILDLLFDNVGRYPMTRHAMGKKLGFATGNPLTSAVASLMGDDLLLEYREKAVGKDAFYYYLSPKGFQAVRQHRGITA